MSGSTRAITLTLDVRGAEQVQAALRQIGPVGEEALKRLDDAAQRSAGGARTAAAALTQLSAATSKAAEAQQNLNQLLGVRPPDADATARRAADTAAFGAEIDRLQAKYIPLAGVQQRYRATIEEIAQAERAGALTATQAGAARTAAAQQLTQATRQASSATTAVGAANDNLNRGMSTTSQRITAAGFQLQDFAVQVQGGTSALTAFAQQAPQFLGVFGAAGAIAGAAVAIGAVAIGLLQARDNISEVNKANEAWKRSQAEINELLLTAVERTARIRANTVLGATGTLMGTMDEAGRTATSESLKIINLERAQAQLQADLAAASPRNRASVEADVRENEAALANARAQADAAGRRATEARRQLELLRNTGPEEFGPPAPSGSGEYGRGGRALLQSRDDLADARRIAGMSPTQRPIEEARIKAEREAENLNITGLEREELIRNRVAEATARQEAAVAKLGATATARTASALRSGEVEATRSEEQLEAARQIAAAETPREAMLIRQRAEIERVTAALRVQNKDETDPAIKAAREAQIERIKQARTETAALLEVERNRLALFSQQQRLDMQGLERQSMGMGTVDRARFLAEETERQRISSERLDPSSMEALERIRRAGEIAVGDEALRRVKEYTGAVQEIGSAFSDAFVRGIFEGKKLGDMFKDLDKQIAQIILRVAVMKPLENALSGVAGSLGNAIGSYFGGGSGAATPELAYSGGASKFANGGIMTEYGNVPLRKYARGGIASSPQLAMFGEGSGAEAYVPLPDGRRIPVESRGGGGTTIMIDARGAEQGVEARIEAGIRRATPGIVSITKGSLAGDVNRGGRAAQTYGRRS